MNSLLWLVWNLGLYNIKEIDINPTLISQIREIVMEMIYSFGNIDLRKTTIRGGSRTAATSKMEHFVINS